MIFKIALFLFLSLTIINGTPYTSDSNGMDITVKTAYKDPEPSRDGPESLRVLDNYLETIQEYVSGKFYMIHDLTKSNPRLEEMHTVGRNLYVAAFDVSFYFLELYGVLGSMLKDPCYGVGPNTQCRDHIFDIKKALKVIDSFDSLSMDAAEKVRTKLKKSKEALNDIKISAELLLDQILYQLRKENNVISGFDVKTTVESFHQALNAFGNTKKVHTPQNKEKLTSLQVELDKILDGCARGDISNDNGKEIERISGNFKAAFKVMDRLAIGMEKVSEVVIEQISNILVDEEPNKYSSYLNGKELIFEHLKVNGKGGMTVSESHTDLKDLERYYNHLNLWKRQTDFLAYRLEDSHQKAFYIFCNA